MTEQEKAMYKSMGFHDNYDPKKKIVKQEEITFKNEPYFVSTVDLGINHAFCDNEPPLYYETMIFGGTKSNWCGEFYCDRYTKREEALKAHEQLVADILTDKYEIKDGYFERKE